MIVSSTPRLRDVTERPNLVQSIPFFGIWTIGIIGPFFVGWSWAAVVAMIMSYIIRMFFVTAFMHRYFSHRAYKMPRWMENVAAILSCTTVQKGPLWWAQWHRHHHKHSDQPEDVHTAVGRSPRLYAILWSHFLWILCDKYHQPQPPSADLAKIPLLTKLEKNSLYLIPPFVYAALLFGLGILLGDEWHTNGLQMLVWGFFTSTFFLHHGTFIINSLAHMVGSKARYDTRDESRNHWFCALITGGEGWHRNHHHKQLWVNQAEGWPELALDWTYWGIRVMAFFGLANIDERHSHKTPRPAE
jgi:stearoyl-CoA desaturase (delta-9 desaturase)